MSEKRRSEASSSEYHREIIKLSKILLRLVEINKHRILEILSLYKIKTLHIACCYEHELLGLLKSYIKVTDFDSEGMGEGEGKF